MQRSKDRDKNDAYFTPPETVKEFLAVQDVLTKGMSIWEPACGNGNISKELICQGYVVHSTDLNNFGFGLAGVDFLNTNMQTDAIITNPPFTYAEEFITHALTQAPIVIMLLRLSFLEGQKRSRGLWRSHPPHRVMICGRRPSMYKQNHTGEKHGGFVAYAWYVWLKGSAECKLQWIIDTGVHSPQYKLF